MGLIRSQELNITAWILKRRPSNLPTLILINNFWNIVTLCFITFCFIINSQNKYLKKQACVTYTENLSAFSD